MGISQVTVWELTFTTPNTLLLSSAAGLLANDIFTLHFRPFSTEYLTMKTGD